MAMGSGLPDEYVPILRMQNAGLPNNDKPQALASIRNTLAFPQASRQMCRLFGPRGSEARQDVLLAADLDTVSEEEDFAAWVAYRKAKKDKRKEEGMRREVKLEGASPRRRGAL